MKIKRILKANVVIVLFTVVSTLGSLYINAPPIVTAIFVFIGLFAYLYSVVLARRKEKQDKYMQQAQAILLNRSGAGNLHFQAFLEEIKKKRECKNDIELLEKALELEPTNIDAYAMLCNAYALKLAFSFNVGDKQNENFKHNISVTKKMARDALKHHPNMYELHAALGMLYDTEGNHEKARKEFRICGSTDSGGGWHLLMSTSWRMSGDYQKAIDEANQACEKGIPKQFVDLYFGEAYCGLGNYEEAEPCLLSTLKIRGNRPEFLSLLAEICYMQVKLFRAAKYQILNGLVLLFVYRRRKGFMYFGAALVSLYLGVFSRLSKVTWPFFRKHPVLFKRLYIIPSPEQPEFSIANFLVAKGNIAYAGELLKKVHKIKPKNAIYYSNLAVCLAEEGDVEKAISVCDQAIELDPDGKVFLENRRKLETGCVGLVYLGEFKEVYLRCQEPFSAT